MKKLNLVALRIISLTTISAYADESILSANGLDVSLHRENLVEETLILKNTSGTNINALSFSAIDSANASLASIQFKPGANQSCNLITKQHPLGPNQICSIKVVNTENKQVINLASGEINIKVDSIASPLRLKIKEGSVLYAGGTFTGDYQSTQYNHIAYWDGTNWNPITQNVVNGVNGNVYALAYDPYNKCVVVGGAFSQVGQTVANNIARYCGGQKSSTIWQTVSTGTNGPVHAIKFFNPVATERGYLVGGDFSQAGGADVHNITYDYTIGSVPDQFVDLWGGVNFEVDAIDTAYHKYDDAYPDFFVTGENIGAPFYGVAQFNFDGDYPLHPNFVSAGSGLNGNGLAILAIDNGPTIVSGNFTQAGGVSVKSIAEFDSENNNQWTDPFKFLAKSPQIVLNSLTSIQKNMFVTGDFQLPDGSYEIAQWDGSEWSNVGGGIHWSVNTQCSTVDTSNNLYVGGQFKVAGLTGARDVAMWNGTRWYKLGSGLPPIVKSLLIAPYLNISKQD